MADKVKIYGSRKVCWFENKYADLPSEEKVSAKVEVWLNTGSGTGCVICVANGLYNAMIIVNRVNKNG